MEFKKLTAAEMRSYEAARLRQTENEVRKELASIRMDIYTAKSQQTGKIRGLKKALARLMTVRNQNTRKAQVQKAIKA